MNVEKDSSMLFRWIAGRRSIRRYRPEPISRSMIKQILRAATWAPSAHNRQPWRFVIMVKPAYKERLAAAMGSELRADLAADGVPDHIIERDVARSYRRISKAPALVLLCLTMEEMDPYPDEKRSRNEWIMATQSVAMAGQNLLLAAHANGLGACWMCAPLFCQEIVRRTLNIPADWQPQGLITMGYPAENKVKDREPLEQRTLFLD